MNHHYADIRDLLGEPLWWDEAAVPRYCEFGPRQTNNIYARQCCLVEIACQDCDTRFKVAFSYSQWPDRVPLDELVRTDEIHYGDPPNTNCCPAGATMNSVPIRVLEFWQQNERFDWERVAELERDIACDWAR